jgi:hypothetical protein
MKKALLLALIIATIGKEVKAEENQYTITYEYETRLTSYYPRKPIQPTGCGLGIEDFGVNDYGWYTYKGKLVVATATNYLLNYGWRYQNGVRLYNYYDVLILNINGVDYEAIVLDSCGICMTTGRIDLFVVDRDAVIDTTIIVKEVINNEMV